MILVVFCILLIIIFMIYLGYPIIMACVPKKKLLMKFNNNKESFFIPVSMIISVHNEASIIEKKIKNTLELDYPRALLQIIIASNACTDRTVYIAQKFTKQGIQIVSTKMHSKTFAQNKAVKKAIGEILIFSDANSIYKDNTIKMLVRWFKDQRIGLVQGKLLYQVSEKIEAGATIENVYWDYENILKNIESRSGRCIVANGSIMAMRKKYYSMLKPYLMEDFVFPVQILEKGLLSIFDNDAVAVEDLNQTEKQLFEKKFRIVVQDSKAAIVLLIRNLKKRNFFIIFQILFHKVLRWFSLLFLIPLTICTLVIAMNTQNPFMIFFLWCQIIFYFMGIFGWVTSIRLKLISVSFYFFLTNTAALLGIIEMLRGRKISGWNIRGL